MLTYNNLAEHNLLLFALFHVFRALNHCAVVASSDHRRTKYGRVSGSEWTSPRGPRGLRIVAQSAAAYYVMMVQPVARV